MKRLVVIVPGILGDVGWDPLVERLKAEETLAEAQWLRWDHHKRWYSLGRPDRLARNLKAMIDKEWALHGSFDDIIMAGHSSGGLFVRQAYLLGCGIDYTTRQQSAWAGNVSRLILFAGVNRGVNPQGSMGIRICVWMARAFPPMRRMLSWHLLRGSEFITNLRIEWIRHFAKVGADAPVVMQLLGTRDTLVTRDDSIDIEQFRTAYYIEIPEATHGDLHRLDSTSGPDGRYALLRDAFVHEKPVNAENIDIEGPDHVVFVLHGIRADNRTWVNETVTMIKERWPGVEPIGPGYGYFSAFRFAVPMIQPCPLAL